MNPMNITFAWPSFLMIGPDKTRSGMPTLPPTVTVKPISDFEPPRSSNSQKRKLSMNPHALPGSKNKYYINKRPNNRLFRLILYILSHH